MKTAFFLLLCQFAFILQGFSKVNMQYEIQVTPDFKQERIHVQLKITQQENETKNYFLLSGNAKIEYIKIGQKEVKKYIHKENGLSFPQIKNIHELEMKYSLPLKDFLIASKAVIMKQEGVWYPLRKDALFASEIRLQNDGQHYVVSSGDRAGTPADKNLVFKNAATNALHLIFLPVDNFSRTERAEGNVNVVFYRGAKSPAFEPSFCDEIINSYTYFADYFKVLPVTGEFSIMEIPDEDFQICQSLKGGILFGRWFYEFFLTDQNKSWVPHEVCHQWWGNSLYFAPSSENYRFMEESITEYLKGFYVKEVHGEKSYDSLYQNYAADYKPIILANKDKPISEVKKLDTPEAGIIIYSKAPMMLNMLVKSATGYNLKSALSQFYRQFANTVVTYQDLLNFITDKDFVKLLDKEINRDPGDYALPHIRE